MSKMSGWLRGLVALVAVVAFGLMLTGCTVIGTELPFEPLIQSDQAILSAYQRQESKVEILRSIEDAQNLSSELWPEMQEKVLAVDYDNAFVVVVFQGLKPGTGNRAEIQRIVVRDGALVVYARFTEPDYGVPVGGMPTSPCFAAKVEKTEELGSNTEVILKINEVKKRR